MGSNPSAGTSMGMNAKVESGLIFNQLICEFESRHPCQKTDTEKGRRGDAGRFSVSPRLRVALSASMWVVAQLVEHRTVTAGVEGSSPFDPPKLIGTVAER